MPKTGLLLPDRITQHTSLKRVIGELRKSDKALYVNLQERLHRELLEKADPGAVQTEAIRICSALEKQALDIESNDTSEADKLYAAWQDIATHVRDDMSQRYQRVRDRLAAPPAPSPEPVAEIVVDTAEEAKTEVPSKADEAVEPVTGETEALHANESLFRLFSSIRLYETENGKNPAAASISKMRNHLEKSWKRCEPPHPDDVVCYNLANIELEILESTLEKRHAQFEAELNKAQGQLAQLETELEQGELHKALETRAALQQLAKGHSRNKEWQTLNNKMHSMQARLRELRDWQHWSNNKIRKRLIDEMEILPAADLHPDALLDRIKSLQIEWKTLEHSEQIPGDKRFSAAPWMWRKFSAAGHTAFDTAKPYLDKRSEIQSRHAQSLATFCAELEQMAQAEPVDWVVLGKGLTRGRKKLHALNEVPANQRQKLARKLKSTLDMANAALQKHYQAVEVEKMKLIRSASQLVHLPERSDAIAQAKSLQSNWKAAGSLWRSKEQELWNQFRAHLDPLFSELKTEQASIRAADSDRLAAQKALCNELKEILKSGEELSSLHGKVQGLQDSWKDIEHPDRKFLLSFQEMVEDYQQRVEKAQQQQVKSERERWWLKSALLHELTVTGRTAKGALSKKTEKRVTSAWPEDNSGDAFETLMDQTCKDILAGESPAPGNDKIETIQTQARALCISLEFLAGLPSPAEDRDQRMKYQVDRLAQSMSGETPRQAANEEALEAEKTWLGFYALPEADFGEFGKRIKRALSAILETV